MAHRGYSIKTPFHAVVNRYEDDSQDHVLVEGGDDPRISTKRHSEALASAVRRGRRLTALAAVATVGAVVLAPTIARGVVALAGERFACDPSTPQALYSGPNAFTVATQIPGVDPNDWDGVPLRQSEDSRPIPAAEMAYTFTGEVYGPARCE